MIRISFIIFFFYPHHFPKNFISHFYINIQVIIQNLIKLFLLYLNNFLFIYKHIQNLINHNILLNNMVI